jgi:hypothetical protein
MRLRLIENFHQFKKDSQLHKEKEMADFRKWFLAFAVLALLSSIAVPASAQPALQCVANAGVPPTVRAEGLTELVGDLLLNCTGGVPTPAGGTVPQANVTVFLNLNITSRITSNPFTEALLILDEPHSPSNPTVPLQVCDPANANAGVCSVLGAPGGNGVGTYNPLLGGNGTNGLRPNVFQGRLTGANQVTFLGVPIDAPGTNTTRIIRITNIRANANQSGASSTLIPTTITAFISITSSTSVALNNPQQTVAFIQPGLAASVRSALSFIQCVDANPNIAKNPANGLDSGGQGGQQFLVRFDEGFASSWKVRNIGQVQAGISSTTCGACTAADLNQNVPGALYNTEAGFQNNSTDPTPNPPGSTASVSATPNFPNVRGLLSAGVANHGTRIMVSFTGIPNGTQIFVPTQRNITVPLTGAISGLAVLTSTDANGAGAFSATSGNSVGLAPVSVFNGAGIAVYEVEKSDVTQIERLEIPVAVAFVSNAGNNLPAPGVQSSITGNFAPLSTVNTASDTAPIPRFAPSQTPKNSFIINKCSCNILFPFVSNQQGFDTGVAIANTSQDPFGTTPQQGNVTLNYYSGGTPPPAQTTNAPVPGGQILTFTLSGGGNFGINATPGFQGYIIAQAQFQFCHAFAYISAQGALPTAPGASEGYLGIVLDAGVVNGVSALNRTGQVGEVQAH